MKSKVITLKGSDAFIRLIAGQFGVFADNEINLIKLLIEMDMFNPFHLCKYTRERIRKQLNVPYPSLNTSLRRLIKSGIIANSGKNMYINPGFRGLADIDAIVFKTK